MSGTTDFLRGDGTGNFTVASDELPTAINPDHIGLPMAADLDRDGDLDVFVPDYGSPNTIFTNLTRHLGWRGLPRIGKPLQLDIHGPALEPWVLGIARGSALFHLPPFGFFMLDPSTFKILEFGMLDATGFGEWSRTWSDSPFSGKPWWDSS